MYKELSTEDQLLLAIEFHLDGLPIPNDLCTLLGKDLIHDITNPIVNKVLSNDNTEQNHSTPI